MHVKSSRMRMGRLLLLPSLRCSLRHSQDGFILEEFPEQLPTLVSIDESVAQEEIGLARNPFEMSSRKSQAQA